MSEPPGTPVPLRLVPRPSAQASVTPEFDSRVALIRRYDKPGPRYTSYPTAVQFNDSFDEPAYRATFDLEATVPSAQSSLKWGAPFYTLDGKLFCAMGALKNCVAISIYAPPEAFDDPKGQLEGTSPQYRVLKVVDEGDINAASVKRWLKAAAAAAK